MSGVSLKHNNSVSVDENNMGNALNFKLLIGGAVSVGSEVVLNVCPALSGNVLLKLVQILVEAQTDDSDAVTPDLLVVCQHFLVVRHRSLARRAPCGPEVVKDDLTSFVLNVSLALLEHVAYILNYAYVTSN